MVVQLVVPVVHVVFVACSLSYFGDEKLLPFVVAGVLGRF